jgi:hypothetical protein
MAMERISQGTRTTLTGCMEPSLLKRSKKNMMEKKNEKMRNQKLYFSDFGRPSDRLYCTFRNPEGTVKN